MRRVGIGVLLVLDTVTIYLGPGDISQFILTPSSLTPLSVWIWSPAAFGVVLLQQRLAPGSEHLAGDLLQFCMIRQRFHDDSTRLLRLPALLLTDTMRPDFQAQTPRSQGP